MLKKSQAMSSAQHMIFSVGHANVIEQATEPAMITPARQRKSEKGHWLFRY